MAESSSLLGSICLKYQYCKSTFGALATKLTLIRSPISPSRVKPEDAAAPPLTKTSGRAVDPCASLTALELSLEEFPGDAFMVDRLGATPDDEYKR